MGFPETPKRPVAKIQIDWDPESGRISYASVGATPMEELGVMQMALTIRMEALRHPPENRQVIVAHGPLPHIRN